MQYQWQRGGVDVSGATSSTFTLKETASSDDGTAWAVRVANAGGSVLSSSATLSVKRCFDDALYAPGAVLLADYTFTAGPPETQRHEVTDTNASFNGETGLVARRVRTSSVLILSPGSTATSVSDITYYDKPTGPGTAISYG